MKVMQVVFFVGYHQGYIREKSKVIRPTQGSEGHGLAFQIGSLVSTGKKVAFSSKLKCGLRDWPTKGRVRPWSTP